MTLTELVDHVGALTGYVETDDQAACKKFLMARDRMIYDAALWKSSLVMASIAFDASTSADHAAGIILLPEVFYRPVALRSTIQSLRINALESYFRMDFDKFSQQGNAQEFVELSPVWFTVRPNSDPWTDLSFDPLGTSTFPIDCTEGDVIRILNPDGATLAVDPVSGATVPGGHLPLSEAAESYFVAQATGTFRISYATGIDLTNVTLARLDILDNQSIGEGTTLSITGDVGTAVRVIWRDQAGKRYTTQGVLPLTLTPDDDAGFFELEALYKPTTTTALTVSLVFPFNLSDTGLPYSITMGTLATTDTRSPAYARLRVFAIPSTTVTLSVLGKAKYQPMDFATQEPMIRNCENALIAFARGDLLRRGGENANAELAFQEATALLQALKDLESVQAANNPRIQPEQGYGPEWGVGPYEPSYF